MRKIMLLLFGLFIVVSGWAQDAATPALKTFWDDPINHPMMPLYVVSGLVVIVILLVMVVTIYLLRVLNMLVEQGEKEKAAKLGTAYVRKPTWWNKLSQQLNASVPLEMEKSIELDHNYDGVRELDNHLPPWWKWLFYVTIVWAVIYIVVFHVSDALPLSEDEYKNEVALAEEQIRKVMASQPMATIDESTLQFTNDAAIIEKGKAVFMNGTCSSCHRNDGGGNTIGPNLTDEYWIHGGDIKNIFSTIKNGAIEKGMPAWGKSLSPTDIRNVTFYVVSLQGTNPANAKAPQGELFKQTPTVASDTTKAKTSLLLE